MSLPDQTPRLPKLPFLISDALLLFVGWMIVDQSRSPLSGTAIWSVVACVIVGAVLTAIPFLSDYKHHQDEALDERQRGLEALARTANGAAEQISIAANGLHEIAELAHKNLKQAEQLPQKVQEKIAEFNAQLDNAKEDEREEMEKELAELRSSESERLQAIAAQIHKDLAEFSKLEATIQKHVASRTDVVSQAAQAMAKAQTDTSAMLNESIAAVSRELAATEAKAVAAIEAKLTERAAAAVAAIESATAAAIQALAASVPAPQPAAAPLAQSTANDGNPQETAESAAEIANPPKKPRKHRRDEPRADEPAPAAEPPAGGIAVAAEGVPAAPGAPSTVTSASEPAVVLPEPAEPVAATPMAAAPAEAPASPSDPAPAAQPMETARSSAEPDPAAPAPDAAAAAAGPETSPAADSSPAEAADRPARKRTPRKPAAEPVAELPLELGNEGFGQADPDEGDSRPAVVERVISSDGATRLIVTAYIGIGNRLFIRGEGPGLSWEKGVPLQFVSIGKWRWETMEASVPVSFRLYKNDEIECTALGQLVLDPGHQQEVTAKF